MKNLKSNTKKLILTKKGTVNKALLNMLSHCRIEGNKIYTGYYSGSGRFTSRHSAQSDVTNLLNAQGYKFTTGNDSERGGANGEFVKVSKTAIEFIYSIKNNQ